MFWAAKQAVRTALQMCKRHLYGIRAGLGSTSIIRNLLESSTKCKQWRSIVNLLFEIRTDQTDL